VVDAEGSQKIAVDALAIAATKQNKAQSDYNNLLSQNAPDAKAVAKAQTDMATAQDDVTKAQVANAEALKGVQEAQDKYNGAVLGIGLQLPMIGFNIFEMARGFSAQSLAADASRIAHGLYKAAFIIGTGAMTAAQWLFNAAASANPIGIIILAIIGLIALLYFAWTNDWGGIREAFQATVDFLMPYIQPVIDAITGVINALFAVWNAIMGGMGDAWKSMGGVLSAVWDVVMGAIKAGINIIIDYINLWITGLNLIIDAINIVTGLVGITIGHIPTIPTLAEGGIIDQPTFAMIGEAGPEAVIPLDRLTELYGGGGSDSRELDVTITIDPPELARLVDTHIAQRVRRLRG